MSSPSHAVVLDFDGTCTPKGKSLWRIIDDATLTPVCSEKAQAMRERYLPGLLAGTLPAQEEREWFFRSMDLYMESGLTANQIMEALAKVRVHDGLHETLQTLQENNIPTAVISYGVEQFISAVLLCNGLRNNVSDIYALELAFDKPGRVTGYRQETAVFPDNKGTVSRLFADKHGVNYDNILAVGDSGGDRHLGHLQENRFGLAKDEKELSRLLEFCGEAAISNYFDPARQWLECKLRA